jgi:hypothetical protein
MWVIWGQVRETLHRASLHRPPATPHLFDKLDILVAKARSFSTSKASYEYLLA